MFNTRLSCPSLPLRFRRTHPLNLPRRHWPQIELPCHVPKQPHDANTVRSDVAQDRNVAFSGKLND
jgi:hypothetical protein